MKLDLVKRPAAVITELLDAAAEHPVECDILLPDYCPDIVRVLTCRAETDVTGRSVNGATLTVDGMTIVTLCYLGEVGGVRKTTVRQPFSKSFELSSAPAAPVVFASAQKSALSCRAVSRRRVDVRGTLQISATVILKANAILCSVLILGFFVMPRTMLSKVDCFTLLIEASLLIAMPRFWHNCRIRFT